MERAATVISPEHIEAQLKVCRAIADITAQWGEKPLAFVDTYGCPNVRV